jgi:hypothetical protein
MFDVLEAMALNPPKSLHIAHERWDQKQARLLHCHLSHGSRLLASIKFGGSREAKNYKSPLEPGTCDDVERQYTKHQILLDSVIHRNLFPGIRRVSSQILSNSQRSMCQFYRLSNETSPKTSYGNPKSSEYIDKLWLRPKMNYDLMF